MDALGSLFSRFRSGCVGVGGAAVLLAGCVSHSSVAEGPATAASAVVEESTAAATSLDSDLGERPKHIMAVHRRKCGACHTPVEPGSVPRAEAEAAMRRHHKRAKLSDREWTDMVEYISDDGDLRSRPTAHLP